MDQIKTKASKLFTNMPTDPRIKLVEVYPRPWEYNPSSWKQRIPICLLALVGFFISTYLGLYQWRLIDNVWDPIFGNGSEVVLDSHVSESMKQWVLIPDAILGAIAYLGDAIYGLAGSTRRWWFRPWLVIIFGLDVIPLGIVSIILVVLQGFAVGAWCLLCLLSALVSLLLIYFAYDEVWSSLVFLYRVWKETRSFSIFWATLWGRPTFEAYQVAMSMLRPATSDQQARSS